MQLINLLLALPILALAAPSADSEANNYGLSNMAMDELLDKRACDYNGCKCDTRNNRKPQGQFCGGCHWSNGDWVITAKRVNSHVYECSPTGKCCDYGYASDCAKQDGTGRCG
jgi:hypothetical protein